LNGGRRRRGAVVLHLGLIIVFDDLNLDFKHLPVDFDVELRG
jgi:hypothetical protein